MVKYVHANTNYALACVQHQSLYVSKIEIIIKPERGAMITNRYKNVRSTFISIQILYRYMLCAPHVCTG